ncbi:hypothetical protein BSKO_04344 [Bryopsis sp. KO-2023]|nr:hypothetical protein BSKO_04344 [Bryopsis sp. KO-2023]
MVYVLYKLASGWGLPSLSPACIQAEALLRFSGADFAVESTSEPGRSPTGCLPCLERDQDLAASTTDQTEFDAARRILDFLKNMGDDVDAHLTNAQRAVAGALVRLVESDLEPATISAAWIEAEGYREYRKAYAGPLPFPLNHMVPLEQRFKMRRKFKDVTPGEIYGAAEAAIDCIAHFLGGNPDFPFSFGETPCSLDAVLYGHLLFYNLAPVVAPVLQKKFDEHSHLREYVDRISSQFFTDVAPIPPARTWVDDLEDATSGRSWTWSDAAQGKKPEPKPKKEEDTPEEKRLKKWGKIWLTGAAAALLGYAWWYPPPVHIVSVADLVDEGDDEYD